MKYSNIINRFFLLLVPFLFTGCYTQFQTHDQFPLERDRYADYYLWDGFNERAESQAEESQGQETYNENDEYLDEELALEMQDIYFQDFETKRWYQEHYANKLFWEGYREGYTDGFYEGWAGHYPYSARYSLNRHRYLYGYTGAFHFYDFYNYPGYSSFIWFNYNGFNHLSFYTGYFGHWGYYGPYYDWYWGHPYYSYGYHSYGYYYNNYHKYKKYRNADIYRKGPRNGGLANTGDYRTRSGSGLTRGNDSNGITRGSGLTRTRGTNKGTRIRSTGSSVGRSSSGSVGRSGPRSRGSSVGKGRTNSNNGKSRGSGSSVGKKRSSNGNSGKSRSRDNYSGTSVRDINVSDLNGRTYTIPARKVQRSSVKRSSGFSSFRDFFGGFSIERSSSDFSIGIKSTRSTSGSRSKISRGSSNRSSGTKVTRSSSSSRSSGTKSRGSSSSSKKRSRGGN